MYIYVNSIVFKWGAAVVVCHNGDDSRTHHLKSNNQTPEKVKMFFPLRHVIASSGTPEGKLGQIEAHGARMQHPAAHAMVGSGDQPGSTRGSTQPGYDT